MRGKFDHASHAAAVARVVEIAPHAESLRNHLGEILASPVFRGSRRSQEMLRYVVEHALEGQFDRLKERTIGVEIFSREPDYNTGDDSIVRVSASDVRKRLSQYYSDSAHDAAFRIELPSGSYIPEFRHIVSAEPEPSAEPVAAPPHADAPGNAGASRGIRWRAAAPYIVLAVCLAAAGYLGVQNARLTAARHVAPAAQGIPWTSLLDPGRRTYVIISDVNLGAVEDLLGQSVMLSDYAARRYWNDPLPPDLIKPIGLLMRRQFTAVPDVGLAVGISELAQSLGHGITVRSARALQIQDFKSDDNFILLGSVRTNPWVALFDDQLHFRMEYDAPSQRMVCLNTAPKPGESTRYVPTAVSFASGAAYATVAFFPNPNQGGYILSIAGTNGEGTEIAGNFVIHNDLFWPALEKAGLKPDARPRPFQVLLRLRAVAGAPNGFEVITWHWLDARR